MNPQHSYPKLQLNLNIRTAADGQVIENSCLANVRSDDPQECLELYDMLKKKLSGESVKTESKNDEIVRKIFQDTPEKFPACEICGAPMLKRISRDGRIFMGCKNFFKTGCTSTMPVS